VGPVYGKENGREAEQLAACYRNSLWLADQYQLTSISFPAISTGIFGYPLNEAVRVMARSIGSYFFDPKNLGTKIQEVDCVFYTEEKFAVAVTEFDAIFNRTEIV
jgi:O-acetyl-ADP-ribose deacetylase